MKQTLDKQYRALVASGELENDPAQVAAVQQLDQLARRLTNWHPDRPRLLSALFGGAEPPNGLYIHGKVGRGKTMLMDLFYDSAPVGRKRRVHFHQFMAQVHDLIGKARKQLDGDPIPHVARQLTDATALLCFDELHITDIADAMILGRLFEAMFANGLVVVATSNAAPTDLYKHGLNRQLFLPFVDLIEARMDVLELDADKDFRLDKLAGRSLYFSPLDETSTRQMDRLWQSLTGGATAASMDLDVLGHKLHVPLTARGAARFGFDDLCAKPLGPNDFLHVAQTFHTVLIDNIPILTPAKRNEARRFINLIDTLYDNGISLAASAQAEPDGLYVIGVGSDLFLRTASRLMEMRSDDYLAARAARHFSPVEPAVE